MCELNFDETCDAWSEVERKARKEHRCSCCRGLIAVGDKYIAHWSVYEHETYTGKLCQTCRSDRQAFADAHEGTLVGPADFWVTLDQCITDGDPDSERQWRPMLDRIIAARKSVTHS